MYIYIYIYISIYLYIYLSIYLYLSLSLSLSLSLYIYIHTYTMNKQYWTIILLERTTQTRGNPGSTVPLKGCAKRGSTKSYVGRGVLKVYYNYIIL